LPRPEDDSMIKPMKKSFKKIQAGYARFRQKYVEGDNDTMLRLAHRGQNPDIMVVACSDSRVDPALILQADPGDLFIVRNVANIIPPYEKDDRHHGTSAALEFGICYLNVKHLVILGHAQCGGMNARLHEESLHQDDFISNWVSVIDNDETERNTDRFAQKALFNSYQNCLSFPWIKSRIDEGKLKVHLWFFDIETGTVLAYDEKQHAFTSLDSL